MRHLINCTYADIADLAKSLVSPCFGLLKDREAEQKVIEGMIERWLQDHEIVEPPSFWSLRDEKMNTTISTKHLDCGFRYIMKTANGKMYSHMVTSSIWIQTDPDTLVLIGHVYTDPRDPLPDPEETVRKITGDEAENA